MSDVDQLTALAGPPVAVPVRGRASWRAQSGGALAMVFVGASVAVSGLLVDAPLLTGQAVRYAAASLLLVVVLHVGGRRVPRPRGRQWLWLLAVVLTGLVVFNLALVYGSRHAEPAVLGVAVACVPLALATLGPLLEGASPAARVLLAAAVVTVGAALVEGLGHADVLGLAWAGVVFACEAAFTLCAVPLLPTLGAHGVSVHTTWLAALVFGVLGVLREGPTAVLRFDVADVAALVFLAVCVTAAAFLLWYSCVQRVGAGRAGLLTGIAPVAATATGIALGGAVPGPAVLAGVLVVAVGLGLGFGAGERS